MTELREKRADVAPSPRGRDIYDRKLLPLGGAQSIPCGEEPGRLRNPINPDRFDY
jgi:hypothetical protein